MKILQEKKITALTFSICLQLFLGHKQRITGTDQYLWIYFQERNFCLNHQYFSFWVEFLPLHHPGTYTRTGYNLSLVLFGFPTADYNHHCYLCLNKQTICSYVMCHFVTQY